jgi:hypothetical protein
MIALVHTVVTLALAVFVSAVPTYDGFATRDSIGTLVPGSTVVQALAATGPGQVWRYLSSAAATG